MTTTWILAANSARARFFEEVGYKTLEEIDVIEHPASRVHGREIVSDSPGVTFDSAGKGRHAKTSEVAPQKEEAVKFAGEVAAYLHKAHAENRFHRLYVVAAPAFLGLLRDKLSPATAKTIADTVDKDLTREDAERIREAVSIPAVEEVRAGAVV